MVYLKLFTKNSKNYALKFVFINCATLNVTNINGQFLYKRNQDIVNPYDKEISKSPLLEISPVYKKSPYR